MKNKTLEPKTDTQTSLSPYQAERTEAQQTPVLRPDPLGGTLAPPGSEATVRAHAAGLNRATAGRTLRRLQRQYGNRYVQRVLAQRQGGTEGFQLDDETAGRINRTRGGGQPLDGAVQAHMSETLGHDFSGVRVHTGSEADELNQQLSARAFTTGTDIFFKRGAYDPVSNSGRKLIAHELTHVVQQRSGRVSGRGRGMTVGAAGDAFEREADAASKAGTAEEEGEALNNQVWREVDRTASASQADISVLQGRYGNQVVQRLLAHWQPEPTAVEHPIPPNERSSVQREEFLSLDAEVPAGHDKSPREGSLVQRWICNDSSHGAGGEKVPHGLYLCSAGHARETEDVEGNIKVPRDNTSGFKKLVKDEIARIKAEGPGEQLITALKASAKMILIAEQYPSEGQMASGFGVHEGERSKVVLGPATNYLRNKKGDIIGQVIMLPAGEEARGALMGKLMGVSKGMVSPLGGGIYKPDDFGLKIQHWNVVLQHELVHAFLGTKELDNKLKALTHGGRRIRKEGSCKDIKYDDVDQIEEAIVTGIADVCRLSISENAYRERVTWLRKRYMAVGIEKGKAEVDAVEREGLEAEVVLRETAHMKGKTLPASMSLDDQLFKVFVDELRFPEDIARQLVRRGAGGGKTGQV